MEGPKSYKVIIINLLFDKTVQDKYAYRIIIFLLAGFRTLHLLQCNPHCHSCILSGFCFATDFGRSDEIVIVTSLLSFFLVILYGSIYADLALTVYPKILSFNDLQEADLTHSHTMTPFDTPGKHAF